MKEVVVIVNPSSGQEKAKTYEKKAVAKLESLFDKVTVKYTEKSGDATRFATEAAQNQCDSVIVMGGDGTVNEGISGLAEQNYRPTFGFFPLGTVNDLARALSLSLDPEEAIANFSLDRTTTLDIGKINDAYFMNVVAIGSIPAALNDVESEEKTKLGKMAYFVSGLKQLANTKTYDFQVVLDGVDKKMTTSTMIIGLTNSIGGFEQLLPDAKVNDGLLHLIYLKDQNVLDTVKSIPDLIKGVRDTTENLVYHPFKQAVITLEGEEELVTNIDGDEGERLPLEVTVLPSHLTVYSG